METKGFSSPIRKLVAFFRSSRNRWKRNYQELKRDSKLLSNQVRAVEKSRARWKEKAKEEARRARRLAPFSASWCALQTVGGVVSATLRGTGQSTAEDLSRSVEPELLKDLALAGREAGGLNFTTKASPLNDKGIGIEGSQNRFGRGPLFLRGCLGGNALALDTLEQEVKR